MIIPLFRRWLLGAVLAVGSQASDEMLDLKQAVVVAPASASAAEKKAVAMLVEEVERRAQVRWPVSAAWPADGRPVIAVGRAGEIRAIAQTHVRVDAVGAGGTEGFHLRVIARGAAPAVLVLGNDARGVLFAVGRLLRSLRMARGNVRLAADCNITSAPRYGIRGHQIGNRPLNNSADAWTVPMWEQYIRDLAVFGANAVELIPPYAFAGEDSPHFVLPPLAMMAEVSRLLDEYGMDVWIWYPALEKDYSDVRVVEAAVNACTEVFRKLPRVDAVFVPGGDPGHTPPNHLMPYLEKLSQALRRHHRNAGIWVSPQGFDDAWMADFYAALKKEPGWLAGIVHGPGVRVSLAQLRSSVPRRYPIRLYPDITHTVRSQYPVPDWDVAYALAYDREPINPRPIAQSEIFLEVAAHSGGFITYSDGVNDDVNKAVWSALGWDPAARVADILGDYGRYFIGDAQARDFAQGLLALERNWQGSLLANMQVPATLHLFQSMERSASPRTVANWRFQQALYRAYYDAYLRNRLIRETAIESRAMEHLAAAPKVGSLAAMEQAERALDQTATEPHFQGLRSRLFELGAALYKGIGMQLSFDLYKANRRRRAASLDTMDEPLNDRPWLKKQFAAIRQLGDEPARLKEIDGLVNWRNPGPGGFYDDLGDPQRQPHLVRESDSSAASVSPQAAGPLAWASYANSSQRAPIKMQYDGLDPDAEYKVRVVYAGENVSQDQGIRLMADGNREVHPYIKKPLPVRPVEFDIPVAATRDGALALTWNREITPSGRSRGAQVAEVWLIKK